jgi:hypothetical protein
LIYKKSDNKESDKMIFARLDSKLHSTGSQKVMALVAVRSDRAAPEELPICLAKLVQVTSRVTRWAVLVRSGIEHAPELEDLSPGLARAWRALHWGTALSAAFSGVHGII